LISHVLGFAAFSIAGGGAVLAMFCVVIASLAAAPPVKLFGRSLAFRPSHDVRRAIGQITEVTGWALMAACLVLGFLPEPLQGLDPSYRLVVVMLGGALGLACVLFIIDTGEEAPDTEPMDDVDERDRIWQLTTAMLDRPDVAASDCSVEFGTTGGQGGGGVVVLAQNGVRHIVPVSGPLQQLAYDLAGSLPLHPDAPLLVAISFVEVGGVPLAVPRVYLGRNRAETADLNT
jgi:hypothetical protein